MQGSYTGSYTGSYRGRLKALYPAMWQKITGNKEVLETISGMKLDFENGQPENNNLSCHVFRNNPKHIIRYIVRIIGLMHSVYQELIYLLQTFSER